MHLCSSAHIYHIKPQDAQFKKENAFWWHRGPWACLAHPSLTKGSTAVVWPPSPSLWPCSVQEGGAGPSGKAPLPTFCAGCAICHLGSLRTKESQKVTADSLLVIGYGLQSWVLICTSWPTIITTLLYSAFKNTYQFDRNSVPYITSISSVQTVVFCFTFAVSGSRISQMFFY